jgi:hypothetical protein
MSPFLIAALASAPCPSEQRHGATPTVPPTPASRSTTSKPIARSPCACAPAYSATVALSPPIPRTICMRTSAVSDASGLRKYSIGRTPLQAT